MPYSCGHGRRQTLAVALRVHDLAADHKGGLRQHAETPGQGEDTLGIGKVHVGQRVPALVDRQLVEVDQLRVQDRDRPRRPIDLHGIDDDQSINGIQQLLHEVDPADPDLDHPHTVGDGVRQKAMRHGDPEPVVTAQHVPEARDDDLHPPYDTGG